MRARLLVMTVAFLLGGCSNDVDVEHREGLAPWLLWGQSTTLNILGGQQGAIPRNVAQLAQVRYARPDSWRFLLSAKLTQVEGSAGAANFTLNWNFSLGLGRGVITIPAVVVMTWTAAEFTAPLGPNKYATSGEIISTRSAVSTVPTFFEEFPAESIQIDVDGEFDAMNTIGQGTKMEIGAFFAPVTHIRPEWQLHQFPGGEHKGQ